MASPHTAEPNVTAAAQKAPRAGDPEISATVVSTPRGTMVWGSRTSRVSTGYSAPLTAASSRESARGERAAVLKPPRGSAARALLTRYLRILPTAAGHGPA